MRMINILATWADGKQESSSFPASEHDNDDPLWIDHGDMTHVRPLANVRIWTTEIEDAAKPEMSDAEFDRRLRRWIRIRPDEFEAWLRKRSRIYASPIGRDR